MLLCYYNKRIKNVVKNTNKMH